MFGKKKKDEKVSNTEGAMRTTTEYSMTQESRTQSFTTTTKTAFGRHTISGSSPINSGASAGWKVSPAIEPPKRSLSLLREEFFKPPSFGRDAVAIPTSQSEHFRRFSTTPSSGLHINNPPVTNWSTRPKYSLPNIHASPSAAPTTSVANGVLQNISDLQSKIKIKVVKSSKFYDDDSRIPTYKTRSKTRGKVLLINNIFDGDNKRYRAGSEVDESNIHELFRQMGFKIEKHRNKKKKDIESIIEKYRNDKALASCDISIVIVMSHGTDNDGTSSTVIETVDHCHIPISWIVQQFDRDGCKHLIDKPKIFIFQCCRGKDEQQLSTDAVRFTGPRKEADVLLAYSTIPGYVSYRDPKLGTLYIQAICQVFMEHAHDTDVENLLKIVDNKLEKHTGSSQTSSYENRGFKRCYFHPK